MDLLDKIKKAGVTGAGGAGFPTHVKLNCKVGSLIVNAAECEPLLRTDKYYLNTRAEEIVSAAATVAGQISAEEVYIAIKKINERETANIGRAIQKNGDGRIKIFPLGNYYPAGDEQMLVYDITGRAVPPSGIPLDVGVVVSNAATMANIYDAMRGIPVTHKILTVAGAVRRPQVLRVPIGISFKECLDACGGAEPRRFLAINGGPMMGRVLSEEELSGELVTKTTSGIIVVPLGYNFISRLRGVPLRAVLNRAKSACIQCSFCTDQCPRRLIGHGLRPHMIMRQMAARNFSAPLEKNKILEEALLCCECGICETFSCPMNLSPRQVNIYIKQALAGTRYQREGQTQGASPLREYRKIAPAKIMARMGLSELYGNGAEGFMELDADYVKIPLKQHIGAPAIPEVSVGDRVSAGELVASGKAAVSAGVHASISGRVTEIDDAISIAKEK